MSSDKEREQACQRDIARGDSDPVEKFRAKLMIRKVSGIKSIGRMFKIMDDDGNWTLNFEEFKKGVQERAQKVTDSEARELFEIFDKNNTGTVEYKEFLGALRPPMSQNRLHLIGLAFNKMDKDGSGEITEADLKGVYDVKEHPKYKNGEWTASQVYKEFLKTFDVEDDPDGIVTKEDFINYYAGVSMNIDNDAYFDLMMRNSWGI